MSAYEAQREDNIRANELVLASLGLSIARPAEPTQKARSSESAPRRKRANTESGADSLAALRRSKRVKQEAPEVSGAIIDALPLGEDVRPGRQMVADNDTASSLLASAAAVQRCREALQAHREQLRNLVVVEADTLQMETVRRWGAAFWRARPQNWAEYVQSRTARPFALLPSPFALLQEEHCADAWRLLVAVVLMSRVASKPVKLACISAFFRRWGTPTAFLEGDVAEMEPVLRSLGLFPSRLAAITAVTEKWVGDDVFVLAYDGRHKIKGIGPFAVDSFRIFAMDDITCEPTDKTLQNYLRWRIAQPE